MEFTDDEKKRLLRFISELLKHYRGAGPKIHYVRYYPKEIHVFVEQTLTTIEKNLFQAYGKEYYDSVEKFYRQTVYDAVKKLDQTFHYKFKFELLHWELDYINDKATYIIKHS